MVEHRLFIVALQNAVQRALDSGAHQLRMPGVIYAQMNVNTLGGSGPEKVTRYLKQWVNVGHANQAKTDTLAGYRVDAVMVAMQ